MATPAPAPAAAAAPVAPAPVAGAKKSATHTTVDKAAKGATASDKSKAADVEAARIVFDTLRAKGYLAFRVSRNGAKGKQMKEFDPNAERMVMVPQMQGG